MTCMHALILEPGRTIGEIQHEFNTLFPYLSLEFYKGELNARKITRRQLEPSVLLKAAGLKEYGELLLHGEMSVKQVELLAAQKGLMIRVNRQSGTVWLETTMTSDWTLNRQNEHGREITSAVPSVQDPSIENSRHREG